MSARDEIIKVPDEQKPVDDDRKPVELRKKPVLSMTWEKAKEVLNLE